ncbi:MAG: YtxH domain-containing protein [Candidatus Manganitrophaceae bacterium]
MEKKSQFKILFTGAVIGAIGALLLAPQSGQKTRERLAKQTQWAGWKFGEMAKIIAEQAPKSADRNALHNRSDYAELIGEGSSRGRTAMVIVGVLAAATSTLLFAPRSGKETRQWLAKQMRAGCDALKVAAEKVQIHTQKGTEPVRDTVKEGVEPTEGQGPTPA